MRITGEKYKLWQVFQVYGGLTAVLANEVPPLEAYWYVERPVRAVSARGAVRKINTRTKVAKHPQKFINPGKLSVLPKRPSSSICHPTT